MPDGYGTYFEPFVGGGALFFNLTPGDAVINDINKILMLSYKMIASHPEEIMNNVLSYLSSFNDEQYYTLRALFNEMKVLTEQSKIMRSDAIQITSLFLYLNRTCFNGLHRENKKGENNVPVGKFAKGPTLNIQNFLACSKILRNARLMSRDFESVVENVEAGDFVYFDPPYQPTGKQSFTKFNRTGFGEGDQRRLAVLMSELTERGAFVLLSNSDTPLTRELYGDMFINNVSERRNINSDTGARKGVNAVIVANYEAS